MGISEPPDAAVGPIGVAATPGSWGIDTEWQAVVLATAAAAGLDARPVRTAVDVAAVETLLIVGKPTPTVGALLAVRGPARRILWSGEPLLATGRTARTPGARLAANLATSPLLERFRRQLRPVVRRSPLPWPLGGLRDEARAERERYVNLRRIVAFAPRLDRVAVTNRTAQCALVERGIAAQLVPFGHEPAVHGELTPPDLGPRDIPILILGQRSRRSAWRRSIAETWLRRNADIAAVEGVWGGERNLVLRRARVMLNVQRVPGNFAGYRLVLALAAGVAVVSEPMADPFPFVPGVHYVEAPLGRLLPEARALLAEEARRRRIVEAGQALIRDEFSMADSLSRVLRP